MQKAFPNRNMMREYSREHLGGGPAETCGCFSGKGGCGRIGETSQISGDTSNNKLPLYRRRQARKTVLIRQQQKRIKEHGDLG